MSVIPISELQPGDVLLYNSDNLVGRLIRAFDDAEVSHAALYLGDGKVGESLIAGNPGININPLAESISGCHWVEASRLRHDRALDPVLSVAHRYLEQGNRYAYGQIFLLAAICLTRKLAQDSLIVRRIAECTLRGAARIVEAWRQAGREPMICSEFVYRTYDEALPEPDDPFSLEILSQQIHEPRRWFSSFRRRRRLLGAAPHPESPVVHPHSLLAKIETEPDRLERPARMARALQNGVDIESEIEQLAREYFGESLMAATPEATQPSRFDVSEEEVESAAEDFARYLLDAAPTTDVYGNLMTCGSASIAEVSPVDQLKQIVGDFVTPGDLHKSPSLRIIGRLP